MRDADPETARKACSWSALFALHSGDAECATDILRRLDPPVSIATAPDLWHAIIRASAAIDIDPAAAVGAARDALNACDALGDQGRDLLGYALGTYGRALLHVSRAIDALEPLSAAVEHHARNLPREEARSRVYYATALRRAGRPEDALEVAKEGLRLVRNVYPDWAVSQTTSLFLHLEIGRVLLALGRPDEAMAAFDVARAGQRRDHDYPRLSAIRGIAEAARRLGDSRREREAVESILRVAGETTGTIQRVAAIGVGEALLRGPLDGGPTQRELVDTWSRIFELAPDPGSVARLAECLVY
ncbi:MAG: hypothetical protein IT379_26700 [Deltaproteobacteria bacterium]|nr:hypothetical protein [Deltaproteobacteria bacterium]